MADLKLGIQMGYWGAGPNPNAVNMAVEAEKLGYDAIFTATAMAALTLDHLSGGRMILGGWLPLYYSPYRQQVYADQIKDAGPGFEICQGVTINEQHLQTLAELVLG